MSLWRYKQCLLAGYEGRTNSLIPQWITNQISIYPDRPLQCPSIVDGPARGPSRRKGTQVQVSLVRPWLSDSDPPGRRSDHSTPSRTRRRSAGACGRWYTYVNTHWQHGVSGGAPLRLPPTAHQPLKLFHAAPRKSTLRATLQEGPRLAPQRLGMLSSDIQPPKVERIAVDRLCLTCFPFPDIPSR